jgi:Glycosyl transferases group 1
MGWAFRRRHGIPVDHPLVGAFGFQTPMKRTEMMIEALADPALAEVQLMIAGEVAPIYGLANFAKARGVAERVHFLGYLPFDEFEAAIAAADLCLNLRYPTAGETSASLLRILAVGRVAIVSDYAQSADLPDDLVVKVPVGEDEVPALIAQVGALLADPGRLEAIGRAARTFVATTHAPRDAARAILDACAALADRERPVARPVFCPPASSLVRSENPSTYTVVGADTPWPAGQRRRLKIRAHNLGAARWLAGEREDGGLALEVQLRVDGVDLRADEPWLPLPIDLEPGQSFDLELSVRRPPGDDVELCVVPHVFGAVEFKNEAHWRSLITRKAI